LMNNDEKDGSFESFLLTTRLFKNLGITVPEIYFSSPKNGFLILENFGETKYSRVLTKSNQMQLYKSAVDALIHLHKKKTTNEIKLYDKELFFQESVLFFDWYLPLKRKKATNDDIEQFKNILFDLLEIPMSLPKVFIHRDYHIDNLFLVKSNYNYKKCGWIDYQDAVLGTCIYDIMSLFEDARRDPNEKMSSELIKYYLKNFPEIKKDLFHTSFKIIAIQRHLKVLGIFSRLSCRDKKTEYLQHMPRVLRMLKNNLNFGPLANLKKLIFRFIE